MKREVWKIHSISDLAISIIDGDRGENYPTINDFSSDGYCLFLNANNVTKNGFFFKKNNFINKEKYLQLGSGTVLQNDIIVTTRGTVGNFAFVDANVPYKIMRLNSGMLILRNDDPRINTKYLYIALRDYIFHREFSKIISGSAQPQLPAKDLKYFHIIFPESLTEQSRIASILSSCDETIRTTQAVIDKYKAIKQGMMRDLFTRGLAAGGTLRPSFEHQPELYKPSELGMIPKDWDVKPLEKCCVSVTDGSHFSPEESADGFFMPSVKNMTDYGFEFSDCKRITQTDYDKLVRNGCKPTKNDILIAKDGSMLKYVFVIKKNLNIVILSSIAILRPNLNIVYPEYLAEYFKQKSVVDKIINQFRSGTGVPRIVLSNFKRISCLVPKEISEQRAIADRLSAINAAISSEEALLAKYQAVKQGLMDRLLTPPEDAMIEDETEGESV
jgi:type I restriction enzyme, S subunit